MSEMTVERLWLLTQTYWPYLAGTAAALGALTLCAVHVMTIRKLRLELKKLQQEQVDRARVVRVATMEEIDKYAGHRTLAGGARRGGWRHTLRFVLYPYHHAEQWKTRARRNAVLYLGISEASKRATLAWLSLLDAGKLDPALDQMAVYLLKPLRHEPRADADHARAEARIGRGIPKSRTLLQCEIEYELTVYKFYSAFMDGSGAFETVAIARRSRTPGWEVCKYDLVRPASQSGKRA